VWSLVDALGWASLPLGSAGRFDEGTAFAEEALELALRLGHVSGEIIARRGVLLNGVPVAADLEVLEQCLLKDLELCTSIRSPWVSQTHAWLAFVTTFRGRFEEGLSHAEQAATIEPDSAWSGRAWGSRLSNRSHAGDRDEVRRMLAEAANWLPGIGVDAPCGSLLRLSVAAEAAAVAGVSDLCGELYPVLADMADRLLMRPFDWALTQRVAGMAAASAGMWEQAEAHFETALRQAVELPNRLDDPQVRHRYGEALLARGRAEDQARAQALLDEAREGYERLGMRWCAVALTPR
jgi:tetratricopeptide (TPR) repeat protein